ncbi:MAG: ABC transporter permease [Alphaproteobacteria bacterium]|nr:ABC transporter permease [Alphaproteobacteria bacterium]
MTAESPSVPRLIAVPRLARWRPTLDLAQLRPVLLPLATAASFLLAWQIAVVALHIPEVVLPSPIEIAVALWQVMPALLINALPTTLDTLVAFVVATLLGVGCAIVLTYSPLLRDILYPNLIAFQLVPKVALAPLFVVWLGIGSSSHIAFAAFVSFFPIVISAAVGFTSADASAMRLCRSLTATEWQCFTMVRFPYALPAIFSGMKIAMTMATIGVIIAEFISSKAGLGFYILNAGSRMETADVFAALFMLCAVGVALFGGVVLAGKAIRRRYR